MDIYQRFKSLLGLSSTNPTRGGAEEVNSSSMDSFWKNNDDQSNHPSPVPPDHHNLFGFNIFSNPLEMHRYFEHQMNHMLKNFGIFEDFFFGNFGGNSEPFFGDNPFGSNGMESFEFPSTEDFSKESSKLKNGSLRDQYLKPGFEAFPKGQRKMDTDLDEKFAINELDTVLKRSPAQVQPKRFFFGQSVMAKTIRNADGTIETHKTVKDQEGNEETTVTKQHGNKQYTITTKKNKDGVREVIENMVNLDEKEKEDFLNTNHRKLVEPPNNFPFDKFF